MLQEKGRKRPSMSAQGGLFTFRKECYNGSGDNMKQIKVVAAVIKKDNQILIAQRIKGEFAGQWEFPGGKVEPGESCEEALKRELLEEMEVQIRVDEFLTCAEYDYETFHLSMDCFLCSFLDENMHLHDHTAIKWISIQEDKQNINWVSADVQVFEAIQKKFTS